MIRTELIEDFRLKNKLTKIEFCKMCDISLKKYNSFLSGEKRVRIGTIRKICMATKISSDVLLGLKK